MARSDLSDAEWRIIAPLLPNKSSGVPRTDDRRHSAWLIGKQWLDCLPFKLGQVISPMSYVQPPFSELESLGNRFA